MKAVSPARAAQLRIYAKRRAVFLAGHLSCESPWDCGQPSSEVQHRRGRRGPRLLDETWWAAACHDCNMRAETTDTGEALRLGWLVRIEGAE